MLVTLFLTDSPENLWNALCTANPLWLLCGLGCMLAYWLLETRALFLVIDGLRKVSQSNGRRLKPTECLRVSMVGQLFNCITPFASGGQPMQAYMLSKYGQSVGTASSALLARFIVYQFVLTGPPASLLTILNSSMVMSVETGTAFSSTVYSIRVAGASLSATA